MKFYVPNADDIYALMYALKDKAEQAKEAYYCEDSNDAYALMRDFNKALDYAEKLHELLSSFEAEGDM